MAEQSPIDIPASAVVHPGDLVFDYGPSLMRVRDDGYALRAESEDQADPGRAGRLEIDGHRYHLVQFHLHSPAEHAFADRVSAMELHLVHADDAGAIAVVAVMLEPGAHSAAMEALLTEARPTIDPTDLLPADRSYVAYRGSLTTPPCSEGVTWRVLVHPIHLSTGQLDRSRAIHHGNARPLQPLDGRDLGP